MQYSIDDLIYLLPIVFVIGWAMLLLLLDVFWLKKKQGWTAVLAATKPLYERAQMASLILAEIDTLDMVKT